MSQLKIEDFLFLSYTELLKMHSNLKNLEFDSTLSVVVFSNITVNQLKEPLECKLKLSGVNSNIIFGDYDNIVQDSFKFQQKDVVIIFWEACNILPNLQYKIEEFDENKLMQFIQKVKAEISLVLHNLSQVSMVIFNEFNARIFHTPYNSNTQFKKIVNALNEFLNTNKPNNVITVDLTDIFLSLTIKKCIDFRFYYLSKALYTFEFFKTYSNYIGPYLLTKSGKTKKALIFDCDNTLWKGILGEAGFENIEMSTRSSEGIVFNEVQSIALELSKNGILIGICSKNNLSDVRSVLLNHPDQVLKEEYISINKSNWNDKVTNLKEIAEELNIGIESMVFIDDSPFEVEFVTTNLPMIKVIQVPKNVYEYPDLLRKNLKLFFNLSTTEEDRRRTATYKEQKTRENFRLEFSQVGDYLSKLGLEIQIILNSTLNIPRIAQISQKTNQFNLRTVRYTEKDIENLMIGGHDIFSISVKDKFGDSGITGLCIIKYNNSIAFIDTFLLSCRVLGRNIEFKTIHYILNYLKRKKYNQVSAEYIKTIKNEQVLNFYDNCSFKRQTETGSSKKYLINLNNWKGEDLNYIKVDSNIPDKPHF